MKQTTSYSILFIFLILFLGNSTNIYGSGEGWKAGVAKKIITPKQSMWMAGYASRTTPSEGKIHDIWAKALVIEDSVGNQAVLITTDLLGTTKEFTGNIRRRLKEKFNLSAAQIMINSSHTHSGPVLKNALYDIYPLNPVEIAKIEAYTIWLEDEIIALVDKAFRSLKPVNIYAENGVSRFQVNRRNNNESTLIEQTELKGPNDYSVPVLKVENRKGKTVAIVFGYACHATVLDINKWSGDYPGFAQIEIEKNHRGATAMFMQGTGADQNPMPRRSVALAKQFGKDLAAAVDRVLSEDMRKLAPKLTTSYTEIELPFGKPSTKKELLKLAESDIEYQKRWANRFLNKMENGEPLPTFYPLPVQIWQIGNQQIFSLGGEVVTEYSIKLKQFFGHDIFVFSYTNDVKGYIPSTTILKEGGYEGSMSHVVYGLPAPWMANIESVILDGIVNLADEAGIKKLEQPNPNQHLTAKRYFSGFDEAHDTYNAISSASDGNIYYVLSSQRYNKGGQMYRYNPKTDSTEWIADLTDVCNEKDAKAIAQGKSHVNFQEKDGKLYFATHVGFYEMIDGSECLPVNAPDGYNLYPGGHILSYNLADGKFEDLAIAPDGEGIITMTLDKDRGQIYGITWPKGYFIHYDIKNDKLKNLGLISSNGEAGKPGDHYRVLCRSMFVDPANGAVYYSTAEGDIYTYSPGSASIKKVDGVNLRLDYFGEYDFTGAGSMGYNWRRIVWNEQEEVAYGVHGNSGYLFKFNPRIPKIEIVDRITSAPSKASGMFDQFSYGYLGFELGHDKHTLYYLTGGPIYIDGKRVKGVDEIAMGAAKGLEDLHLITYDILKSEYTDNGAVFYPDGTRPTYVNSIAIDFEGNVYTLARFKYEGKVVEDLIKIPNPFRKK
ncbi:MAG: neutral/alkaline non-lysosomal ceramidase N-terminal domain-containing protein [Draconibacterium sp.]|nr:neutral/alkaline non-lysosomal ceramidase N-terminal domain-containing protein [Draconibacterium sp.]